jgi:DNA-directed RNA polymerase subunit E"
MSERACRNCNRITEEDECPVCKNNDLSESWNGTVVIMKPEESDIAQRIEAKTPGKYAVRTR